MLDEGCKSTFDDNILVGFDTLMPTKLMKMNHDFVMTYTFDKYLNWFNTFELTTRLKIDIDLLIVYHTIFIKFIHVPTTSKEACGMKIARVGCVNAYGVGHTHNGH